MPLQSKSPLTPSEEPFSTPLVYITENPTWEYKVWARSLDDLPEPDELNGLGKDGWELSTTVSTSDQVYFYFKRLGK
jgi:hypothetical protein